MTKYLDSGLFRAALDLTSPRAAVLGRGQSFRVMLVSGLARRLSLIVRPVFGNVASSHGWKGWDGLG